MEAGSRGLAPPGAHDRLAALVEDSAARVAEHVAVRRASLDAPGQPPFIAAEQALLLGHPFHPTPKSREGSPADLAELSPELRGSFRLHWMAVRPELLAGGSAGAHPAELARALAPPDLRLPEGMVPIPVHPWQARHLAARPAVRDLLDAGLIADLGRAGDLWYPTSSLRTVWRPGAPHQLKLSLGMRITNSRRENLRAELELGLQAHRLLAAGLGASLATAHPRFRVLTDPAWLAVDVPGAREGGFEVALRRNGLGAATRVACLAGLTAERPDRPASLLGEMLCDLAGVLRRGRPEVAEAWFARYLDVALAPLLWLRAVAGVALEAHQQNMLVALDPLGWPAGAWYRDSQGWYVATSKADAGAPDAPGLRRRRGGHLRRRPGRRAAGVLPGRQQRARPGRGDGRPGPGRRGGAAAPAARGADRPAAAAAARAGAGGRAARVADAGLQGQPAARPGRQGRAGGQRPGAVGLREDPQPDRGGGMSEAPLDLLGVGIGPFNLSLAALADGAEDVRAVFLDGRPGFSWHPGLLMEDARLQVPFLADLVSLVDPTSPWSFLAYLRAHQRLYPFYFLERFHIPRREYDDYCRWVADSLPSCRFGRPVRSVDWEPEAGAFRVEHGEGDAAETTFARNVVMGVGTAPTVPEALRPALGERAFHAADYLTHRERLIDCRDVTVIGSGQSGAEVVLDLLRRPRERAVA